jgi:hypothetical protein
MSVIDNQCLAMIREFREGLIDSFAERGVSREEAIKFIDSNTRYSRPNFKRLWSSSRLNSDRKRRCTNGPSGIQNRPCC